MNLFLPLALALTPVQPPKQKPPDVELDPFLAKLVKPDDKDTPLRKLQKERVRLRALAIGDIKDRRDKGHMAGDRETVELQGALWRNAVELTANPADAVKCHEKRVEAAKEWEAFVAARVAKGIQPPHYLHISKAARIDAEITLLKLKDTTKSGK